MAQILDKQGLQHYANKMCNADNRKVGSKSLPTALNDIDTAIDGFKTLFETEYGTPVNMELENNENVFSIGTGTNIDKKDDVENSFTDLKIGGNTLVNLMPKITSGDYIHLNATTNWVTSSYHSTGKRLKPNTKYTVILDVHANSLSSTNNFHVNIEHNNAMAFTEKWTVNSLGRHVKLFTTKAELLDNMLAPRTQIQVAEEGKYVRYSIVLLEGDWTNKPLPQYFEGLKSIGEREDGNHKISISSIGKNIILDSEFKNQNGEWKRFMGEVTQGYSNNVGYTIKYSGTGDYYDVLSQKLYDCNTNQNNILPNTWYTLSFYAKGNIMRTYIYPSLIDTSVKGFVNGIETTLYGDGSYLYNLTNEWTKFTYTFKTKSQIPYRDIGHSLLFRAMPNSDCVISCLILEQGKVATEYKPQQEDKKEISLNDPLRGLPDGVRDTIEKVNGEWKIVRRCEEMILNGSETWGRSANSDLKELTSHFSATNFKPSSSTIICDKYKCVDMPLVDCEEEAVKVSGEFWVNINKSRLSTDTVEGFKEWLSQNNIRVIYKLETPIIEDISPITLQCWKNGTISIDEVLPVESTHTVALNKSAQIQKNIEELSILKNRVEVLEKQYDNSTLNQAYELELLRLDMQLDNII